MYQIIIFLTKLVYAIETDVISLGGVPLEVQGPSERDHDLGILKNTVQMSILTPSFSSFSARETKCNTLLLGGQSLTPSMP